MVEKDDWRRLGQEKYLQGKHLVWQEWYTKAAEWDHDHCEFCGAKFGRDWLKQGYSTLDAYYWICEPCFADFREEFEWINSSRP